MQNKELTQTITDLTTAVNNLQYSLLTDKCEFTGYTIADSLGLIAKSLQEIADKEKGS